MRPIPHLNALRPRGARLALILFALAAIGGCECHNRPPTAPVVVPPLSAVIVAPGTDTLRVGARAQFTAVALDTLGQPTGSVSFAWTSSDPAVATVDATGRVAGVGEGVSLVIVAAGGRKDTATVFVYADTAWYTQTSGSARNLLGVFFLDDGRSGWAVGSGGAIVHTADAGVHWAPQTSNSSANLNAVWFTSAGEGWIAGNTGTVLHTLDAGTTWTRVDVSAGQNLMALCFADPAHGWVVGGNGQLIRTQDGGLTWSHQTLTGATLRGVAAAGVNDVWFVSDVGEIFGTHTGGDVVFRVLPAIAAQALRAVVRRSASEAWAVGDAGLAPRTVVTPDSVAWELRNAGAAYQLWGVHYPDATIGYAVGFNGGGAILRTDDAGVTWQPQAAHTSRQLNGVWFVDALRGWAVGDAGVIVHTARGGLR
ncbi:MAG: Ig-like domain-containing protein [Candidatus Eisenbacteria bacterium]|uniref:Ig-like domain-containing protein n=1 Tax=Eiseniibacteriota bacterium TaxID=2212470 RepID=A0A9D6LBD6_UNCEI|nr:Ig-like domain-containing protein [Candidatus Eisenbacteria bacterium]MBI3540048.1 Ig-like domain-containing protein [Candidatus Eisenbacteria bacterium]